MKKLSTLLSKSGLVKGLAAAAVIAAVFSAASFTARAAEGKVTAMVNIRKEASTDSEIVGSTTKDKTIDILEAVKDSSGTVWYKVSVAGGGYGYIRSDYVETGENIKISTGPDLSSNTDSGNKPAATVPTAIGEQQAVIKYDRNVNIRSGASTQHDIVTSLPDGTSITLIGEANDSAGNKWYQMTCSYNGRTIEGYVRSDLIVIGTAQSTGPETAETTEAAETTENAEENPEEGMNTEGENTESTPENNEEDTSQQEPVEEHKDYEVVYAQNSAGEYGYYLVDYVAGHQLSINELNQLLEVVGSVEAANRMQTQIQNEKLVIIILAVVIVLLFIVLTVLLFKLRDLSYDYEEEEEEEPAPVKKKKAASSEAEGRPAKAGGYQGRAKEDRELYAAEAKEPAKKPAPRKPQNFLIDDDEFEFEFLNMDDKDL